MKKVYLLMMISCGFVCSVSAQATFQWAKAEGHYAYDYGYGINTDASGNVYVAGKYEENDAEFSGTKVSCQGNHDGFLAKYDPSGAIQWVRTVGGVGGDYYEALSTDKSNYVYVSGEIENNTQASTVPIYFSNSTITLTAKPDNDAFLAKYDFGGNLIWAISEGSPNSEKGLGNAVDAQGNVYMCGYFTDATTFGGQNYTSKGGRDIYVAKYNSSGVLQWFRQAGSSERDEAKAAVCDAQGNVYICGMFNKDCDFMGTAITTRSNTPYWDAFVAKLSTNGDLQWVRTGGGDVDDGAWAITVDNAGSVYIGGETAAYAEFKSPGTTKTLVGFGNADSYIAKYNTYGDILWAAHGGSSAVDRIRGIGTDGDFIYATGQFGGVATFGNNTATAVDTLDIFVTVIDANGSWGFLSAVAGVVDAPETLGYESGNAVTGTATGEVYATGGLLNGGLFGVHQVTGFTKTDAFVTKLTWPRIVGVAEQKFADNIQVYPNPAKDRLFVDLSALNGEKSSVCLYNCLGEKVQVISTSGASAEFATDRLPVGVYFIQVEAGNNRSTTEKIIIER